MRVQMMFFFGVFAMAQPPVQDVWSSFSHEEELRKRYVSSSKITLSMRSREGGVETFPYVLRRLISAERGVCELDATFQDQQPVYGAERGARVNCAELVAEFSGVRLEEILKNPDLRAQHGVSAGRWTYFKPPHALSNDCLESSQVTVTADAQSLHPVQILLRAGDGCRPATPTAPFRPGSTQEITFAKVDGIWQVVKVEEAYAYNLRDYQRVPSVRFFGRTFGSRSQPLGPTLQTVKEFFSFTRIVESFIPDLTPKSIDNIEESVSTINFQTVK